MTKMPAEAPESPQEAENQEQGTPLPPLEELARQAGALARLKNMTMGERILVFDSWVMDTFGFLASLIVELQANIDALYGHMLSLIGDEIAGERKPVDVEKRKADLTDLILRSRIMAEIVYLNEKPGPEGPRLLIPGGQAG